MPSSISRGRPSRTGITFPSESYLSLGKVMLRLGSGASIGLWILARMRPDGRYARREGRSVRPGYSQELTAEADAADLTANQAPQYNTETDPCVHSLVY